MKQKTSMLILAFLLCFIGTANAQGPTKPKLCSTCGKMVVNCPYKGNHPKCATCGKLKEKCAYKGNHPKPTANTSPQKDTRVNKQIKPLEYYEGVWEWETTDIDGTKKSEAIRLEKAPDGIYYYSYSLSSLVVGDERITYIIPFEYSIDSNMHLVLRLDKSKVETDYYPQFNEEKRELFAKYPEEEKKWRKKRDEEIEKVKNQFLNSLPNVLRYTIKSCIGDKLILIDSKGKIITYTAEGLG